MFSAVAMPSRPILLDEEPLTFEVRDLGDSATRVLTLSNPTGNATVAYKLRTTQPTLFRVRQGEGILRPGEEVGVRITIKPLRNLEFDAAPKFQVLSVGLDPRELRKSRDIKVEWDAVPSPLLHRVVLPCHFPHLPCPSSEDEEMESGEEPTDSGTRAERGSAPVSRSTSASAVASNITAGAGVAPSVKRAKGSPVAKGPVGSNQVEGRAKGSTPNERGRKGRVAKESCAEEGGPSPVRESARSSGQAGAGRQGEGQGHTAAQRLGASKANGPVTISLEDLISRRDQAPTEGKREIETVSAVRMPATASQPPPAREHYKYAAMRSDVAHWIAQGRGPPDLCKQGEQAEVVASREPATRGETGGSRATGEGKGAAAAARGKEKEDCGRKDDRGRQEGQGGRRQEPMPAQGTEAAKKPQQPCRALPVVGTGGKGEEEEMVAMIKAELTRSAEWRAWARHAREFESSGGSDKGGRRRARSASPFRRATPSAPLPPPPPFLHPLTAPSPPPPPCLPCPSTAMPTISPPLSADPEEDDMPSPPSPPLPPSSARAFPTPSPPPRPRSSPPTASRSRLVANPVDTGASQAQSKELPVEEMGRSAASECSLNASDILREGGLDVDLAEVIKAGGQGLWDSLQTVVDGSTKAKDKPDATRGATAETVAEAGKATSSQEDVRGNRNAEAAGSKEEGGKRGALDSNRTDAATQGKGLGESRGSARGSLGDSKGEGESFLGSFGESLPGGGRWTARREEEARASMRRQLGEVAAAAKGLAKGQAGLRDAVVEGFNVLGSEVVTFASVLHRLCLRSLTQAGGDATTPGEEGAARGHVGVQQVLGVCCVTGAGGEGAVKRVGDKEVEVRGQGKVRELKFDWVVDCGPRGPGPCALFDLEGVGEEVEERVLRTVQEGGVMCVVGEARGRERVGAHALRRTVEAVVDAAGPSKGVGFSVASLEVDGPSGRVVDVLGRPHSPAASPTLYTLTWDQASGDAYVANALQVRLRGVSDARRLCGVISAQLQAHASHDPYGPMMGLDRSTDYNVDDAPSSSSSSEDDEDLSLADSDDPAPSPLDLRHKRGPRPRRQEATPQGPSQHRYLLTLLSITLPSRPDKGSCSSPSSPSTAPNSNPNHKTARIYFLDVLPPRQPPRRADAPSHAVSPRALERALHSRAAIRSPFQPWDIRSIAGGGTLLPLLAEALCPFSRVVVLAHADAASPLLLGPTHVLRLAAKTTQRLSGPAGILPGSLSSDDDSHSPDLAPRDAPSRHAAPSSRHAAPQDQRPTPAAGLYSATEASHDRPSPSPTSSPSLFIPRPSTNPFASSSSSSSHRRPPSATSPQDAMPSAHTSPAAVLRRKRAALAFGLSASAASSVTASATSTAPRRPYGSDGPPPPEDSYHGPCDWQLVAPSFAALDAVAVRRHRLKPWK